MSELPTCKATFKICSHCCKGPKQPGLEQTLEIEENELKVCSACHSAYFCSRECQEYAWPTHKKSCVKFKKQGLVACVVMTDPSNIKQIYLEPNHPVFETCALSRVMARCGVPLLLKQLKQGTNNQWCTYLMIDPENGLAPYPWSDCGTILLCRQDRMPITPQHIYQMGDFICEILNAFGGDEDDKIHERMMTKPAFLKFVLGNLPEIQEHSNPLDVSW